jgi:hypothetical protein
VDHDIPHDVHVEASSRRHRKTVSLDESRFLQQAECRFDGGVVAFDVTDLEDAARAPRAIDQVLRLLPGDGDRLLDEDIPSPVEESAGHFAVPDRRCRDHRGVAGRRDGLQVRERRDAELARRLVGRRS